MMKLIVNYPSADQEANILKMHSRQESIPDRLQTEIETVTTPEEINAAIKQNGEVTIDDALVDYINRIVRMTRNWPQIYMGASPRAGLALMQGARTLAAFQGRDYAIPDDVVQITLPVLRHRVILTAEAEVEGQEVDQILIDMIRTVEVPRK
jgi:MoxR-like ATPase